MSGGLKIPSSPFSQHVKEASPLSQHVKEAQPLMMQTTERYTGNLGDFLNPIQSGVNPDVDI